MISRCIRAASSRAFSVPMSIIYSSLHPANSHGSCHRGRREQRITRKFPFASLWRRVTPQIVQLEHLDFSDTFPPPVDLINGCTPFASESRIFFVPTSPQSLLDI